MPLQARGRGARTWRSAFYMQLGRPWNAGGIRIPPAEPHRAPAPRAAPRSAQQHVRVARAEPHAHPRLTGAVVPFDVLAEPALALVHATLVTQRGIADRHLHAHRSHAMLRQVDLDVARAQIDAEVPLDTMHGQV